MVNQFENYNSDSELELFSDSDNDSLEDFHYNFGMLNVENEDEYHKFGIGAGDRGKQILEEFGQEMDGVSNIIFLSDDKIKRSFNGMSAKS